MVQLDTVNFSFLFLLFLCLFNVCFSRTQNSTVIIEIVLNTGPSVDSPVTESGETHATAFTNGTLKCLVDAQLDYGQECCLRWYFNNKSLPLKSTEKYKTELKSHSKCKQAFILTILNVRENDEGTYRCHMYCEWKNTSASIELHVYPRQNGEKLFFSSILGNA